MGSNAAKPKSPVVLETHGLCVTGGKKVLLEECDLTLRQGEVHALVGKNGTGKSTLLKVLSGMRSPKAGTIETHGSRIGVLIGEPSFMPELTGTANAEYLARTLGVADSAKEAKRVCNLVGLDENAREEISGDYSGGRKQRLGIALALIGNPAVLLLDEPFNFIDLSGVCSIKNALGRLAQKRRVSILIASHVCDHIVGFADRFSFIAGKKLAFQATAQEVDELCERYVLLETKEPERALAVLEQRGMHFNAVLDRAGGIRIQAKTVPAELLQALEAAGVSVDAVRSFGQSYEDLFCRLSDSGR